MDSVVLHILALGALYDEQHGGPPGSLSVQCTGKRSYFAAWRKRADAYAGPHATGQTMAWALQALAQKLEAATSIDEEVSP